MADPLSIDEDKTIKERGADYSDDDDDDLGQFVEIGGTADISCKSPAKVHKCWFYKPSGKIRLEFGHGDSYEKGRLSSLYKVSLG